MPEYGGVGRGGGCGDGGGGGGGEGGGSDGGGGVGGSDGGGGGEGGGGEGGGVGGVGAVCSSLRCRVWKPPVFPVSERKSTRLNSRHANEYRMPSVA